MTNKKIHNKKLIKHTSDNSEDLKKEFRVSNKLFLVGFIITLLIFLSVFIFNNTLTNVRSEFINNEMNNVIINYENMQTLIFMSEIYGDHSTCVIYADLLGKMNKGLWELGTKIDQYRQASENFQKDPFYIKQKKIFNRKEVLYFAMMKDMNQKCNNDRLIISYFYAKKELCSKCDAQSFVLSDLKNEVMKIKSQDQLAIFSFDSDMHIPGIDLLLNYYNITEYPAFVVNNEVYQGLHSKDMLLSILCKETDLNGICTKYIEDVVNKSENNEAENNS